MGNTARTSDIGARIREARTKNGMTQEELANRMESPVYTVTGYEAGVRRPKADDLCLIAAILGVPMNRLLYPVGKGDGA